jgi:DNA-binding NarL/FixJ family response regulator
MTRVVLADDHQLLRQALRRALEDAGLTVVGEAGDGASAIEMIGNTVPDVAVVDVTMPVLDGVEVTRRVHQRWPNLPIVVLTMHEEDELKTEALRAGASAFMTKVSAMHEVVGTIRAVAEGVEISPGVAAEIAREFAPLAQAAATAGSTPGIAVANASSPLTPREEEILQLIADGRSTTDVARELFISGKTVKNHLASIYAKLDARDRTQAVLSAVRSGIVHLR